MLWMDKNKVEKKFRVVTKRSLHMLAHLAKLSIFSNIVLNRQQQANYISMTAAWFSSFGHCYLNTAQRYWRSWQVRWFTYCIPWFD